MSVKPSLSSSGSAIKPPSPSGSSSGYSSPSVFRGNDEFNGDESGAATHIPSTTYGPSQNPSPSVSGCNGSVPKSDEST